LRLLVDAICINQSDLDERSQQVSIMRNIFQAAKEVIVWIGPESDQSDGPVDMVQSESFSSIGDIQPLDASELNAIFAITNRSFWTRVWVIQEIHLARAFMVGCGTKSIDGLVFDKALGTLIRMDDGSEGSDIGSLTQTRLNFRGPNPACALWFARNIGDSANTLFRWLKVCYNNNFQARNERVYIYSLLGVAVNC
ncbi:heterokaryon incompatibility protein-domain-containing protein, partial [Lasiosphaeris hirsuta]